MRKNGSYTVEATFVMTITIWILIAICVGGMYVHDRVVLSSSANEFLATWIASREEIEKKEWEKSVKEKLNDALFLFDITSVETSKKLLKRTVKVKYQVPIHWEWLKKALLNGKKTAVFETDREDIVPAYYMWDTRKVEGAE